MIDVNIRQKKTPALIFGQSVDVWELVQCILELCGVVALNVVAWIVI